LPRLVTTPRFLSHAVMEELVDLHGAVDPDTGHLTCHYYALAPVIVEIGGEQFPGLNVGDCMTLVPGEAAVAKAEEEGEPISLAELDPSGGVGGVKVDPGSLAHALAFIKRTDSTMKILASRGSRDSLMVVFKGSEPLVVIVWKCREDRSQSAPLQV